MKLNTLFRTSPLVRESVLEESRSVDVAFSSEEPVERFFGKEILDHRKASVNLDRLTNGGALLVDHDTRDQVGVVEAASIDTDRKGRATVRFGKSARAQEIFQDVLDGIRSLVSVGYRVHAMTLESENDKEGQTYRVTEWEPLEISLVSIPADVTVGVGRHDPHATEVAVSYPARYSQKETNKMKKEPEIAQETQDSGSAPGPQEPMPPRITQSTDSAVREERQRVQDITDLGAMHQCEQLVPEAIRTGQTLDEFRAVVLKERYQAKPIQTPSPELGLSTKEVKEFRFLRLIHALANNGRRDYAPYEMEVCDAAADHLKRQGRGMIVPMDVLRRPLMELTHRDMQVGVAGDGGNLVATNLLASSFIELLRNRMVVRALGATVLGGLVGNLAIPSGTAGATGYWVAEGTAVTESTPQFGQVALTPKTLGGMTDVTRKLLLQGSLDVEAWLRGELARTLALEIDRAAIAGSGTGAEPEGILNASGIGDVAGGTNGLAPTWAHVVELETDVAVGNADIGSTAYLTNAKVRGKTKTTEKASGTAQFIWENAGGAGEGMLNGYRAVVSNQVPSDLDKGTSTGVCSAILFGNWADLIIGEWGGLDILVDPFTQGAAGTVRVIAHQDVDIQLRRVASFSAMQDALTT